MNISKSYVKCGVKNYVNIDHRSYIDATFAVAKRKPELYSFQTLDLCNTGVVLLPVYNKPV